MDKTLSAGMPAKGEMKGVKAVANGSGSPSNDMNKGVSAAGTMGRAANMNMGGVAKAASSSGGATKEPSGYYSEQHARKSVDAGRAGGSDYNKEQR